MDWVNMVSIDKILDYRNGLFVVRISDNVLDSGDWSMDTITIKEGVVVNQVNIHDNCYRLPDMKGWTLADLYSWLQEDYTGSHPENYHEIRIIDTF